MNHLEERIFTYLCPRVPRIRYLFSRTETCVSSWRSETISLLDTERYTRVLSGRRRERTSLVKDDEEGTEFYI